MFTDPASGFSTTDVRDLDDQIVRFNPADNTMLWTPDNLLFDSWVVDGNFMDAAHMFQVRFGSVSGEKRAYFTEAGRGTLCDLKVEQNTLQLLPTNVFPRSLDVFPRAVIRLATAAAEETLCWCVCLERAPFL